jgi:hypothetical protein
MSSLPWADFESTLKRYWLVRGSGIKSLKQRYWLVRGSGIKSLKQSKQQTKNEKQE